LEAADIFRGHGPAWRKANPWMMDGVQNTTATGLGVTGERLGWVQDRAGVERRTDAAWKIGEAALMIGLAVGGAFVSGGRLPLAATAYGSPASGPNPFDARRCIVPAS
jgi:hypothetical protein